jgi:Rod binding domain-containing protein
MEPINYSPTIIEVGHIAEGPLTASHKTGGRKGEIGDLWALRRACKDFESIFVYTLLKTMRQSLPKTAGLNTSRDIYTSMGDLELARSVAHGRGVGLGDLLFEQLKQRAR